MPHGMSVIVNSPSVFRHTAECNPERHLESAGWLGADIAGAAKEDAGDILADQLIAMMQATGLPNGLIGIGYSAEDIPALTAGSFVQKRLLDNAPCEITEEGLADLYRGALSYW